MKKNYIYKMFFITLFIMFIIPFNVCALLIKETNPVVNTFTIAQPQTCTLTRNYYYVDENDNRNVAKSSTSQNVTCGDSITLNNGLMTLDYDNVKWYIGNTELTGSTYIVNNNVTIDEVYYLNRYSITYNLDGGSLSNPINYYTSMTPTFNLPTPTKNGYNFIGWGTSKTINDLSGIEDISTDMVLNQTYDTGTQGSNHIYVRATSGTAYILNVDYNGTDRIVVYTDDYSSVVQYSTNGTTWTTINNWVTSNDVEYQYFTLTNGSFDSNSGIADPSITYNEFLSAISGNSITIYNTINPYTITVGSKENIVVTAQWEATRTYTLTLYRGTNANNDQTRTQTFVEGVSQAIMTNPFTRNGYTFIGWGTQRNGNTVTYQPEEVITLTADMDLYAKWRRN